MPQLDCPKCGAPLETIPDARVPCCFQCGWNLKVVLATKAGLLQGVLWAYAFVLLLAVFVGFISIWQLGVVLAACVTLVVGIAYFGLRKDVRELTARIASVTASTTRRVAAGRPSVGASMDASVGAQVGVASAPTDEGPAQVAVASAQSDAQQEILRQLASVPRPRPLRRKRNRIQKLLWALALMLLIAFVYGSFLPRMQPIVYGRDTNPLPVMLAVVLILLLGFWSAWQTDKKTRRLLVEGEIALARITSQRFRYEQLKLGFRIWRSVLQYEFQSAQGETLHGESWDYEGNYFTDMSVPVFYDPQTRETLAICGSYYEVAMPG